MIFLVIYLVICLLCYPVGKILISEGGKYDFDMEAAFYVGILSLFWPLLVWFALVYLVGWVLFKLLNLFCIPFEYIYKELKS